MPTHPQPEEFRLPTGAELQKTRKLVGMTQKEVADEIGMSRASLSHWESEKRSPTLEQAKRLIKLYADRFDESKIIWRSSEVSSGDVIRRYFGLPTSG